MKLLERANLEHVQRAIEHEQAAARANAVRAQLDIYKKQVNYCLFKSKLFSFLSMLLRVDMHLV